MEEIDIKVVTTQANETEMNTGNVEITKTKRTIEH